MKNLLLICTLLFAGTSFASDSISTSAWLESDYLYRGVSLSGDELAAGLEIKASDFVLPGFFLSTDVAAWDLDGDNTDSRIDAGFGFGGSLFDSKLGYSLSVHRVLLSTDVDPYSEVRAGLFSDVSDRVRLFGELSQLVSGSESKDTYLEVGGRVLLADRLWASVSGAFLRDDGLSKTDFNHAEATVGFDVFRGLTATGTYSYGGDRLENHHSIGLRYRF